MVQKAEMVGLVYSILSIALLVSLIAASGYLLYKSIKTRKISGAAPITLSGVGLGCSILGCAWLPIVFHLAAVIVLIIAQSMMKTASKDKGDTPTGQRDG